MSDKAIAQMRSELARLKAERENIDNAISELETAITVISRYAFELSGPEGEPLRLKRAISKRAQIFGAVLEILSDGKPRHTDELLSELNAMGIEIGGDKPEANLSAYLSRSRDELGLSSDRRNGWSLAK